MPVRNRVDSNTIGANDRAWVHACSEAGQRVAWAHLSDGSTCKKMVLFFRFTRMYLAGEGVLE